MGFWDKFVAWLDGEDLAAREAGRQVSAIDPGVERHLQQIENKLDRTVQDLADGLINRAQFDNLYRHYQHQRRMLQGLIFQGGGKIPDSLTAGESLIIRQRYAAKSLAYAVYDNESSVPLHTVGNFPIESDLVVGFLSGFRSAAAEILGAGAAKAEAEDGKVLVYVPGEYCTLIVLYSSDPADIDIRSLRQTHRHFEKLNAPLLSQRPIPSDTLIFNYDVILRPEFGQSRPASSP